MITGQSIYKEICGLYEELAELEQSLDVLQESVGYDSIAYKRIKTIREDSRNALNVALRASYEVTPVVNLKTLGFLSDKPNPDFEDNERPVF